MLLLILLLPAIIVVSTSDLNRANKAPSVNSSRLPLLELRGPNDADIAPLAIRGNGMEVGSACHGLEGEWNCMTTAFQRCASGQWSMVLDTAYGTVCEPEGFTYDFQPAFAGWFPPADTTKTFLCIATATAPSESTDATRQSSSASPITGKAAPHSKLWAVVLGLGSVPLLFLGM